MSEMTGRQVLDAVARGLEESARRFEHNDEQPEVALDPAGGVAEAARPFDGAA